MKRYNYKTKKIYESASVFSLSLNEYDGDGKLIDIKDFEDTYSTVDDAIEDAYNIMKNVADNDGFDEDDILYDEDDDTVTFTIDGIGSWVFTVESSQNECDTNESENIKSRLSKRIHESVSERQGQDPQQGDQYDPRSQSGQQNQQVRWVDMNDMNYLADVVSAIKEDIKQHFPSIWNYLKDMEIFYTENYRVKFVATDGEDIFINKFEAIKSLEDSENSPLYIEYRIIRAICRYYGFDVPGKDTAFAGLESEFEIYESISNSDYVKDLHESVSARFARLRKMFESDDDSDEDSDDKSDDDNASDDKSDEDENEDEEMQAVIITVKKGDEDKCKDELIDAGVAEEDIEILDADEDAENVDIRIDVNSVIELKDYLSKKGIDLEEEIGGEIVSDDDETDDENEDGSEEEDENKEGDDEEDFDFDNLGDIFGADEDDEK